MIRDQQTREPVSADRTGSRNAAERFCAWKGGAADRLVFTVFPLGEPARVDDLPLSGGAVVLGVQREPTGARRVLWAAAAAGGTLPRPLDAALRALARHGGGEAHLHPLPTGEGAREALLVRLGFPRLALAGSSPEPDRPSRGETRGVASGLCTGPLRCFA